MNLRPHSAWENDPVLQALIAEVNGWIHNMLDLLNNLPSEGSRAANEHAFSRYRKDLSEIGKKLQTYLSNDRKGYYKHLSGTDGRLRSAKASMEAAFDAAKLFNYYCNKPTAYDSVDGERKVSLLVDYLESLRGWLGG